MLLVRVFLIRRGLGIRLCVMVVVVIFVISWVGMIKRVWKGLIVLMRRRLSVI